MAPNAEQSAVPAEYLHAQLTVFDAVYTPRQTRLLREAAERGCRTVAGLEMFLGQALVQFESWTGLQAPTSVMRSIIEQRLG
jgi:shikimate dehydrogenase